MDRVSDIIRLKWAHSQNILGQGIGVAILDTGIVPHPDFVNKENRIIAFKDFVNGNNKMYDDAGSKIEGGYNAEFYGPGIQKFLSHDGVVNAFGQSVAIRYGSEARRPNFLKERDTGLYYFEQSEKYKNPIFWNGTSWTDSSGFTPHRKYGASSYRPTLTLSDLGVVFFDTTLGKPIWYKGSDTWVDATGVEV